MNNSNISQHRTSSLIHPSITNTVGSRTESVGSPSDTVDSPQTQSVPTQAQSVAPRTQSGAMLSQSHSGLSALAQWAINPDLPSGDNVVQMQERRSPVRTFVAFSMDRATEDMYLDDEVIHFYFARLMERANAHPTILPKTYCFSTQFMLSKLRNQWKKNINFLDFDLILFPIHLITSNHWVFSCIPQTETNHLLRFATA